MLDIGVCPCNHSMWDTDLLGSEVQSQLWLHRKFEVSLGYKKPCFITQTTAVKESQNLETKFGCFMFSDPQCPHPPLSFSSAIKSIPLSSLLSACWKTISSRKFLPSVASLSVRPVCFSPCWVNQCCRHFLCSWCIGQFSTCESIHPKEASQS